jgi:hypothetical protein
MQKSHNVRMTMGHSGERTSHYQWECKVGKTIQPRPALSSHVDYAEQGLAMILTIPETLFYLLVKMGDCSTPSQVNQEWQESRTIC